MGSLSEHLHKQAELTPEETAAKIKSAGKWAKGLKYGAKAADLPFKMLPKVISQEQGKKGIGFLEKIYNPTIGKLKLNERLGSLVPNMKWKGGGITKAEGGDVLFQNGPIRFRVKPEPAMYTAMMFLLAHKAFKGPARNVGGALGMKARGNIARLPFAGANGTNLFQKIEKADRLGRRLTPTLGLAALPAAATWRAGKVFTDERDPEQAPFRNEAPEAAEARGFKQQEDYLNQKRTADELKGERTQDQTMINRMAKMNPRRASIISGLLGSAAGLAIPEKNNFLWSIGGGLAGASLPYAVKYLAQRLEALNKKAGLTEDLGGYGDKLLDVWDSGKIQKQLTPEALKGHAGTAWKGLKAGGRIAGNYVKKHPYEVGGIAASALGTGALVKGFSGKDNRAAWLTGGGALQGIAAILYMKSLKRKGKQLPNITMKEIKDREAGKPRRYNGEHELLDVATEALPLAIQKLMPGSTKQFTRDEINQMLHMVTANRNNPEKIKEILGTQLQGTGINPKDIKDIMGASDLDLHSILGLGAKLSDEFEGYKKNPPKTKSKKTLLRQMYYKGTPNERANILKTYPQFRP